MAGPISSLRRLSAAFTAHSIVSLLVGLRACLNPTLSIDTPQTATPDPLPEPDWADNLEHIQWLFREEQDTGLPPGLVITYNGVSIFLDPRRRWRDRTTKRFVAGPRNGLEGVILTFYGQKIVPAGVGNPCWRDPETGRFVRGPHWSFD
jgi:hypothetical protein